MSPIHKSEAKFFENDNEDDQFRSNDGNVISKSSGSGLRKLAQLAEVINQWENDVHYQVSFIKKIMFYIIYITF